jgi:hypothetical protein
MYFRESVFARDVFKMRLNIKINNFGLCLHSVDWAWAPNTIQNNTNRIEEKYTETNPNPKPTRAVRITTVENRNNA